MPASHCRLRAAFLCPLFDGYLMASCAGFARPALPYARILHGLYPCFARPCFKRCAGFAHTLRGFCARKVRASDIARVLRDYFTGFARFLVDATAIPRLL